jgi:translation initiation factor IF-3
LLSEEEIIEELKKHVLQMERDTGKVPGIRLLAEKLSLTPSRLRSIISRYLLIEIPEGTSAFQLSFREILLNNNKRSRERISDNQVQLIDEHGVNRGIMSTAEALKVSKDRGLELYLVQPDSTPPVARIMNYGKFKFESDKKAQIVKKKHPAPAVKEIKLRYQIAENDYRVKLSSATEMLRQGDKVKLLTILRGREVQHKDMAVALMRKFANELKDVAVVDREAHAEGKSIIMVLSPTAAAGSE